MRQLDAAMDQIPLKDISRFIGASLKVSGSDVSLRPGLSEIIGAIQPEAGLFALEDGAEPLATLICVHDGDLAGLFEVATDKSARNKGHGRNLILSALKWARLRGAREAWLQVEAGNAAGAGALPFARLRRSLSLPLSPAAWRMSGVTIAGKRLLLVAACALVDADGRVLLAQRPEGKQLAGLWEFPGGKVEPGETPEQCIIRELHEEIGIETDIPCLAPLTFASHSYDEFHLLMPLFVCRRFRGIAQPREGQALKWVRPKQMRDYPMPPADAPLIPFLIDLL